MEFNNTINISNNTFKIYFNFYKTGNILFVRPSICPLPPLTWDAAPFAPMQYGILYSPDIHKIIFDNVNNTIV